MKTKITKEREVIPKNFFTDRRLEIGRILIEELTKLKDAKSLTTEECLRLIERLDAVRLPKSTKK